MFNKSIILILLIIFVLFGTAGFVNAKYNCECTTDAPEKTYNTDSYSECLTNCKQYCLSYGGFVKCTEIKNDTQASDSELDNPLGMTTSVPGVIGKIIKAFLGIIGTISLVMFIYGGMLMLTSAGKAEQTKKGQQTLVWASLGILIVFAAYSILKFVFEVVGL